MKRKSPDLRVASVLTTVPDRMVDKGFPGAAVAVYHDGQLQQAVSGIADIDQKEPLTTQTLFGVWSIARVFTATLFAGLSATGRVDLDAPAARCLSEISTAGPDRGRITVAHLLSHTSGLDGDR